jgi:hypothetical protein
VRRFSGGVLLRGLTPRSGTLHAQGKPDRPRLRSRRKASLL